MGAAVAPAVNARWILQEVPRPVPGPNQVLIRIHASGICFTDPYDAPDAVTSSSNKGADLDYGPRGPQHRDNLQLRLAAHHG
jgi:indolepyruvate decarboxylase